MSISEYLNVMKSIQENLLEFLDDESDAEVYYNSLVEIFDEQHIRENQHKLKSLLHLMLKISNNHRRGPNFLSKIYKILLLFKDEIKKYFLNSEIFDIFKSNKRILLFLIEEKIMTMDQYIIKTITSEKYAKAKYPEYFLPEIKPFMSEKWFPTINESEKEILDQMLCELPENFYEKRKIGENDSTICRLIQKDSVEDFISYVNRTNYSLQSKIELPIYETNSFIIKKHQLFENNNRNSNIFYFDERNIIKEYDLPLIKYAAFFGSFQIFQYLRVNNVSVDSTIWLYAIHSKNAELIHLLEEDYIEPEYISYDKLLVESIKCHHNDIAEYIQSNYLQIDKIDFWQLLKNYNYAFINDQQINNSHFFHLCKYDYYVLADILLKTGNININAKLEKKKTPLFLAVEKGNIEIIKLLLECKEIDINDISIRIVVKKRDSYANKETALQLAVAKENVEIVKILLKNKSINVNSYAVIEPVKYYYTNPKDKKTSLFLAVERENIEIIKLLLAIDNIDVNVYSTKKSDDISNKKTSLFLAVEKGNIEIVNLLLANDNIDINIFNHTRKKKYYYNDKYFQDKKTVLFLAAEINNLPIMKQLLANPKIDVNILNEKEENQFKFEMTALHISVLNHNYEIVKLLIERADIDVNIKSDYTKYMFKKSKKVEERKMTALHASIEGEDVKMANLLLTRPDIDINMKSYSSNLEKYKIKKIKEETPLYFSIEKENIELINLLIERSDIDINSKSKFASLTADESYFGQSSICSGVKTEAPIDIAVHKNNIEIIKLLLKQNGIEKSLRNENGRNLISKTSSIVIKKLLKQKR